MKNPFQLSIKLKWLKCACCCCCLVLSECYCKPFLGSQEFFLNTMATMFSCCSKTQQWIIEFYLYLGYSVDTSTCLFCYRMIFFHGCYFSGKILFAFNFFNLLLICTHSLTNSLVFGTFAFKWALAHIYSVWVNKITYLWQQGYELIAFAKTTNENAGNLCQSSKMAAFN